MSQKLVAKIGQIATQGKHKDGFLYTGVKTATNSAATFFYLIEITTPWVDGEKIRQAIVSQLTTDETVSDSEISVENFETTIKKINDSLAQITEQGEHEWIGRLNSIVGVISGEEIIFSQTGNIGGYLFRANKISHITEAPIDNDEKVPHKTFLSIINGRIIAKDKIIFANNKLYSCLSLERLRQILTSFKHQEALNELAKNLRKIKVKDVNSLVFELSKSEELKDNQQPEIILLDKLPDPKILIYLKTVRVKTIAGAKAIKRGLKSVFSWWQKNIQPKISEKFTQTSRQTKKVSFRALKPISDKISGLPKINYFNPKKKGQTLRLKNFLTNILFWLQELKKPQYRKHLYIGIIILLLTFGFIKVQINNRSNSGVKKQAESLSSLNSAKELYEKSLSDLDTNYESGKEELIQARDLAQKASDSPAIADEAKKLLFQIQNQLDKLNNTHRITANTEVDYTVVGDKPLIYAVGADIYSFSSTGEINVFNTRRKNSSQVASIGGESGKIISIAFSDNANLFYLYTDKQKILSYDLSSNTISELLTTNGQWEKATAISVFLTNIYLLDAENGVVWKHLKENQGYTDGSNYSKNVSSSLIAAKSMAIDGDIYILTSQGTVVKIRGMTENNNFAFSGIPTPENQISAAEKIFTNSETPNIYVFDKGNNRVLEFTKTGQYKRQFTADSGITLTDFAINSKTQKLWLLSGNNVFEVGI